MKRFTKKIGPFTHGPDCCYGGCKGHPMYVWVRKDEVLIMDEDNMNVLEIPMGQIDFFLAEIKTVLKAYNERSTEN